MFFRMGPTMTQDVHVGRKIMNTGIYNVYYNFIFAWIVSNFNNLLLLVDIELSVLFWIWRNV